jgi:proline/betaine transport protein TphA
MVLSSLIATIMSTLVNDAQLAAWGWRIPFLAGGLIGVWGLIVRMRSMDPVVYEEAHASHKEKGRKVSVLNHIGSLNYKILFKGVCLTSIMAIANYFLIAYFNTFLIESQGLPLRAVMVTNTVALTVQSIMTLLMGRLSDFVGRKTVLGSGIISLLIVVYPVFWLLTQHDIYLAMAGEVLFALAAGVLTGTIPTTLAEMFDTYHRNMGISISYNISLALFGGTAPLVAISLTALTHNVYAPAWYLMACALIAFLALLKLKESYRKQFAVHKNQIMVDSNPVLK